MKKQWPGEQRVNQDGTDWKQVKLALMYGDSLPVSL